MDPIAAEVKATLEKFEEATEFSEVRTFRFVRKNHSLLLHLTDSGEPNDNFRYWFWVERDGERVGRGNGGRTVKEAIQAFHWSALD